MIMHGVSPVAALISSSVGWRFSANCAQVQPPITCTQCGGGVRRACSRTRRSPSAREGRPSQRTSFVYVSPPRMKCVCASLRPGTMVRRPASITRVFSPLNFSNSARDPTARMRSPRIAIASAFGCFASSVAMRALTISVSAGVSFFRRPVHPPRADAPATAKLSLRNSRREAIPNLLPLRLELDAGCLRLHEQQRREVLLGHAVPDHLLDQVAGQGGERHRHLEIASRLEAEIHVLAKQARRERN